MINGSSALINRYKAQAQSNLVDIQIRQGEMVSPTFFQRTKTTERINDAISFQGSVVVSYRDEGASNFNVYFYTKDGTSMIGGVSLSTGTRYLSLFSGGDTMALFMTSAVTGASEWLYVSYSTGLSSWGGTQIIDRGTRIWSASAVGLTGVYYFRMSGSSYSGVNTSLAEVYKAEYRMLTTGGTWNILRRVYEEVGISSYNAFTGSDRVAPNNLSLACVEGERDSLLITYRDGNMAFRGLKSVTTDGLNVFDSFILVPAGKEIQGLSLGFPDTVTSFGVGDLSLSKGTSYYYASYSNYALVANTGRNMALVYGEAEGQYRSQISVYDIMKTRDGINWTLPFMSVPFNGVTNYPKCVVVGLEDELLHCLDIGGSQFWNRTQTGSCYQSLHVYSGSYQNTDNQRISLNLGNYV
jgi:hypothetical protein